MGLSYSLLRTGRKKEKKKRNGEEKGKRRRGGKSRLKINAG